MFRESRLRRPDSGVTHDATTAVSPLPRTKLKLKTPRFKLRLQTHVTQLGCSPPQIIQEPPSPRPNFTHENFPVMKFGTIFQFISIHSFCFSLCINIRTDQGAEPGPVSAPTRVRSPGEDFKRINAPALLPSGPRRVAHARWGGRGSARREARRAAGRQSPCRSGEGWWSV